MWRAHSGYSQGTSYYLRLETTQVRVLGAVSARTARSAHRARVVAPQVRARACACVPACVGLRVWLCACVCVRACNPPATPARCAEPTPARGAVHTLGTTADGRPIDCVCFKSRSTNLVPTGPPDDRLTPVLWVRLRAPALCACVCLSACVRARSSVRVCAYVRARAHTRVRVRICNLRWRPRRNAAALQPLPRVRQPEDLRFGVTNRCASGAPTPVRTAPVTPAP